MDNATIDAEINEHIQRLQDLNKQMGEIGNKIGVLQEEGRALHNAALEVKGAVEGLAKLKAKQEEKAAAAKLALTLPDKSLVAADGKTVIADANAPQPPTTPFDEAQATANTQAPAAPLANADGTVPAATTLEVVQ